MKTYRLRAVAALLFASLCAAGAQPADPGSVKPAWKFEQEFVAQAPQPAPGFGVFFLGYSMPTLSGPLAASLSSWTGPFNVSLGFETSSGPGSSMLTGIELELQATFNNSGSRFLMNDMAMVGYSLDLAPLRLNLGGRIGLSMLDVVHDGDASDTYTGLGVLAGPEASAYLSLGPGLWVWARGRYLFEFFTSIDGPSSNPIASGKTALNCLSLEAGLGFKI